MNATRTTRNTQLAFEIDEELPSDPLTGSPAQVDPWVSPQTAQSLESVIETAAQISGTDLVRPQSPVAFRQPMTNRQRSFLFALAREQGWTADDVHAEAVERFQVKSLTDLDRRQASDLIRMLQEHPVMPVAS